MIRVPELEADAIRAVHSEIDPAFTGSPQYVHPGLSARLGAPVIVKVETDNPIRSFKGRGTWVAVHRLAGQGRIGPDRPIVVASAGNFGQGIPYAARDVGVSTVVFASLHANPGKVARMRTLGATVHQVGQDFDAAVTAARAYAAEHGGEFLVDGEDPVDLGRRRHDGARGDRRGRGRGSSPRWPPRSCRSATGRSSTASGRG